ncbi:MAG TPA: hypothetical protein VIT44_11795 [Cyclobacteriaceae bacterium]
MSLTYRFTLFLGLLTLFSCIDDSDYQLDEAHLNPSLALPLIYGDLTIQDILDSTDNSGTVKIYPDGLVYLAYTEELKSQDIRELFSIPDKSLSRSFILPPGTLPPLNSDFRIDSISQIVDFELSPEQLNEVALKAGGINYSTSIIPFSSNLDYQIAIYFPDFISRTTQKPLNSVVKGNGNLPLSDYTMTLDKNKFRMKLVLILKKKSTSTVIQPGSSVSIRLDFLGLDFTYIKGFFGDQSVSLDEQHIEIPAFKDALQGAEVSLAQPIMNLITINDNGVPVVVDFKTLDARKEDGTSLTLTLNPPNPISIAYPSVLGTSASSTITVTNAKQVLDFAPSEFYYKADARINKGVTSGSNFLADTSKLRVKLNLEIPLYGSASNIFIKDTINLDLSKTDESEITSASLKLKLINELPLEGDVQFFLTDDQYQIIGELLPEGQTAIVKGSIVNASGELQSPGIFDNTIVLSDDALDKVFKAKHIIIAALMNTSKDATGKFPDVKFKSNYTLNIEAGVLANLKLRVEL